MQNWNINPNTLLNIPGNVWMYWKDLDGHYLGCNDLMAQSLTLSSRQEIIGKTDSNLNLLDSCEAHQYRISDRRVVEAGIPMQFNDSATLPHRKIEFNVIKSPLYENKKLIGMIGLSYYAQESNLNSIVIDGVTLSPRVIQILQQLIRGKIAKEIAKSLELSPRTVEHYLANIKKKLHVFSKSKLIDKVIDHIL